MKERNAISPSVAILAVVATFFLLLFLGSAIYVIVGPSLAIVLAELLVMVIPLSYMLFKRINIGNYIGLDTKPRIVLIGLASGVFIFFFDVLITIILVSIFGPSEAIEESNKLVMDLSSSSEGLFLVVVALSLAGICEEFTFRGFLQNAINSKYSFGTALFVSSLAFGFFHFDLQAVYIISAFLIGLLLGYIYHHWHSYVVSAIAHATINLIGLIIMLLID